MTFLALNFSKLKQRRQQKSNMMLIVILVIVAFGLTLEHQRIKNSITEIEDSMSASQARSPVSQAQPTAQDLKNMKLAKVVQGKLNFPWLELLSSLEAVKKTVPKISIMAIQPNSVKGEVLIAAEAANLQVMLNFVDSLAKQAAFHDVLLVNQQRLRLGNGKGFRFTVKLRWQA